ncbi:MAG: hypothetical protein EOP24_48450 [Hyphomicrobiales bacterium]|nr:MAG: hypothetical protein EOP24_48450 [Hyphomicrobiales bacterium]
MAERAARARFTDKKEDQLSQDSRRGAVIRHRQGQLEVFVVFVAELSRDLRFLAVLAVALLIEMSLSSAGGQLPALGGASRPIRMSR